MKSNPEEKPIIVLDFGAQYSKLIARRVREAKVFSLILPYTATADEIRAQEPDGLFLSNGPGDPAALPYLYPTLKELIGELPIFGICLGHQVLAHALGGTTYKLKFGHRGGNQPVLDKKSGRVEISAQNHGFAVDADSFDDPDIVITHINLNDQSVEGLEHKTLPIFSVQYHPESSPGPHDSRYLFERFTTLMDEWKAAHAKV